VTEAVVVGLEITNGLRIGRLSIPICYQSGTKPAIMGQLDNGRSRMRSAMGSIWLMGQGGAEKPLIGPNLLRTELATSATYVH
jgi:hypothetical protein